MTGGQKGSSICHAKLHLHVECGKNVIAVKYSQKWINDGYIFVSVDLPVPWLESVF